MQVLVFIYRRPIDFPEVHLLESDCITTKIFNENNYKLAETKIHFHYSLVKKIIRK